MTSPGEEMGASCSSEEQQMHREQGQGGCARREYKMAGACVIGKQVRNRSCKTLGVK